jgi:imidazolonepropionase
LFKKVTDAASGDRWTLIRGARQLVTLHGPTGPRRGSALGELSVIEDGALLVHNGVIRESGPARRVENLAQSRKAFEIDLGGRVVLPAFVDPDAVLVSAPAPARRSPDPPKDTALRVLSVRRLEAAAAAASADWARLGTLSVGAHTGSAVDLRDTVKVLRIHHSLQGKPLRIRSILSPLGALDNDDVPRTLKDLAQKWLPTIRRRKLASMLELNAGDGSGELSLEQIRPLAMVAASLGFSIRIRAKGPLDPRLLQFAVEAGTVSIIAPAEFACPGPLADIGCLHVIPMSEGFREDTSQRLSLRQAIDSGTPISLGSGYRTSGRAAFNPQFLLHLACDRFGLSCEEAIVASTYNAACALRMSHVTGSLDPGKLADLAVMDVSDYRDLTNRVGHNDVEFVIRAGQTVYRRASLTLE